ncbi:MAG: divalent-cation tolerance protein CutA [bacterium]|nr:divalent-cation tolerance protein CutA [bacterium]
MERTGRGCLVVLMTCASLREARAVARGLLRGRTAACVSIYPRGESHYWWRGRLETAREHLLVAKTTRRLLPEFVRVVKRHHGYEVPEIVSLPISGGSVDYLAWLRGEVGERRRQARGS